MQSYKENLGEIDGTPLWGEFSPAAAGDGEHALVLLVPGARARARLLSDAGERLTQAGYHVLMPDIMGHLGLEPAADAEDEAGVRARVADRRALAALELAAGWLAERGDAQSLAVLGFGLGGTLAFMMGCISRRVACVVGCCGTTLYAELSSQRPTQPLELFLNLDRPYLGLFAEHDASEPEGHYERLQERMEAGYKSYELVRYGGTRAGFMDPCSANYDEASAHAAWQRTLAFLKDSL